MAGDPRERNRTDGDILYEVLEDLTQDDFRRFKYRLSHFSYEGQDSIPRGLLETADYETIKNLLIDVYGEETALNVTMQVLQMIGLMGPAEELQHRVTQHRARCKRKRMPRDILFEALEDLTLHELELFKKLLCVFFYGGRGPIPRGRLEKADYVTTRDLLIDVYGEEAALDVTKQVLQMIRLMGPSQHGYRISYVDDISRKYKVIKAHNARLGEYIKLKKRFVTPSLMKKHRDERERQYETIDSGIQMMVDGSSVKYSPTTIQALFDLDDDVPKTVVLYGPAGIGKTIASQKIMLDWASGKLYKDKFQFVFYIGCREVNTITGNISLAGYLSSFCGLRYPSGLLQSIFRRSEKILFIVDGFDELKWSPMSDREVCDDPFQEVSKEILLNCLVRKKILSKSSLIITTRSLSLMMLKDFAKSTQYVEILGFTEKQREEYFHCFFQTKKQADLVFSTVKDNDNLFTMCVIPVICWIICYVMRLLLKEGLHGIDCTTSTSIYLLYLKSLILYHRRGSAQAISTCIQKLCALANEGVWDQRILFEESDLVRHGLSVSEVESVFLNKNIFHKDTGIHICYSFVHLSVQEFLAALYYVLGEKSVKENVDFESRNLKDLLEASERQPHLTLTVRFLFGLSSEKQIQEIQKTIECPISFRDKMALEEWLKRHSSGYHDEILCCLYETQDEDYVERMMSHFFKVRIIGVHNIKWNNIGYRAVAYCLERSTIQHTVTFRNYIIGPQGRRVLAKALCKCVQLRFLDCRFPLTEEELHGDESSLYGLFILCQMKELELYDCALTSSCCDDLRSVITANHSLTRLNLSLNALQDSGIKLLCEGLTHPACALQELRLCGCGLTSSCCDDLLSVITTNHSLTSLDLSGNALGDSGIKRLCEGLRHPACTLEYLRLQLCGLTSSCCNDLRSVITINCSLTTLDLSWNVLGDSGTKRLCEGLKHPACALQKLSLQVCGLTSDCCDDLLSVITTNRSLTRLDLSLNNLKDCAVKLLECVRPPLQLLVKGTNPLRSIPKIIGEQLNLESSTSDINDPLKEKPETMISAPTACVQAERQQKGCRLCGKAQESNDVVVPVLIGSSYRLELECAGLFRCQKTGIQFQVKQPVTIDYYLDSWHEHLSGIQEDTFEIMGPLFNIKTDKPHAVSAVHLPHYLCIAGFTGDKSQMKIAHFKDGNMILERPTRIEPFYAILENPTFSFFGPLLSFMGRKVPIHGNVLIYFRVVSENNPETRDYRIHLYVLPETADAEKTLDVKKKKFRRIDKPAQTDNPVYTKIKYVVQVNPDTPAIPKTLRFKSEPYQYTEINLRVIDSDITLYVSEETSERTVREVWMAQLTRGDIQECIETMVQPQPQSGTHCERSKTHEDILRNALEGLEAYDFKVFRSKLSDFSYKGKDPIPRGHLQNADWNDTKDHLIKEYGEKEAVEVTIEVLKLISLRGPAEDLRQKVAQTVTAQKTSSDAALAGQLHLLFTCRSSEMRHNDIGRFND